MRNPRKTAGGEIKNANLRIQKKFFGPALIP